MAAQTWDSVLALARSVEGRSPHITANIAVLTQLRERWPDSVDMLPSMFDLVMVPSGAGWPDAGRATYLPTARRGTVIVALRPQPEHSKRISAWVRFLLPGLRGCLVSP